MNLKEYCMLIDISLSCVPMSPIDTAVSIDSGNGLVPNKWQVITWTNDEALH